MIGFVKTIKLYKASSDFIAYIKVAGEQNQETVKVCLKTNDNKINDFKINLRSSRQFTLRKKTFLFRWTNSIPMVWKKSTMNNRHNFSLLIFLVPVQVKLSVRKWYQFIILLSTTDIIDKFLFYSELQLIFSSIVVIQIIFPQFQCPVKLVTRFESKLITRFGTRNGTK